MEAKDQDLPDFAKRPDWRPSKRGALLVLGIFVFGAIIMGGLYLTPRSRAPRAPAGLKYGIPDRPLRIVCYDLRRQPPHIDPMIAAVQRLNPDYLLVVDIEEDDAVQLAELMGMQQSFHPQLYQRSQNIAGKQATWGNCILSRYPLYEGSAIAGKAGVFGTWAISVVDGRAFVVGCCHFAGGDGSTAEWDALRQAWIARGSPPIIVAVLPAGGPAWQGVQIRALQPDQGESLIYTSSWQLSGTGAAQNSGAGGGPAWAELAPPAWKR